MAHIQIDDDNITETIYQPAVSVDLTGGNTREEPVETEKVNTLESILDDTYSNTVDKTPDVESKFIPTNETATVKLTPVTGKSISKNATVFDPRTIIPKEEVRDTGVDDLFSDLNAAVDRSKQEITEFHKELEEKMYEEFIESKDNMELDSVMEDAPAPEVVAPSVDEEDPYDEPEDIHPTKEAPIKKMVKKVLAPIEETKSPNFDYKDDEMEDDFKDLDSDTKANKDKKERDYLIDELKSESRKVINPNANKIDLNQFSISSTSVKPSTIMIKNNDDLPVADWVQFVAEKPISMSALTGPEIIRLDPSNSNRNTLNTLKDIYRIIYNHIVDSNKPEYELWLKNVKFMDLDHIYFAMYMATFNGSNFVSYQCPECKKVFINDVSFKSMVKYADDDTKKRVQEILQMNTNTSETEYSVDMYQASSKYAFGMKVPSVWNVIIEAASLPEAILDKYADLIDTIAYIDSMYVIDYVNHTLNPIEIKPVNNDQVKTSAKRIRVFYDVIKTLSSDEFFALRSQIINFEKPSNKISYVVPEAVCPYCDHKIPENDGMTAEEMLFTRHQLGAFASM